MGARYELSQDALATKSGLDRGRISQFETGSRNLTLEAAGRLAPHVGGSRTALRARQLGSTTEAAVKSGEAGKSAILRTAAELEDLKSSTENEDDRKVLADVIERLEGLAKDGSKPADGDKAEKSRQRVPSRDTTRRDAHGKRLKPRADIGEIATKSEQEPRKRDGLGRRR